MRSFPGTDAEASDRGSLTRSSNGGFSRPRGRSVAAEQCHGQHYIIPAPIDALVAAINGGDTEAFLDAFAAGGLVDDWGSAYRGREAIAAWSARELIGAKGHLGAAPQRLGDVVTIIGDWKSSFFSGPSRMEFLLDGEKIRELRISSG